MNPCENRETIFLEAKIQETGHTEFRFLINNNIPRVQILTDFVNCKSIFSFFSVLLSFISFVHKSPH